MAIPAEKRRRKQVQSSTTSTERHDSTEDANLEEDEQDILAAGRTFADAKEFMRASDLLQNCKSSRGRFMYRYFDFLVRIVVRLHLQLLKFEKAEEKKALRDWHNLDCEWFLQF